MHLHTILAFAFVFWREEQLGQWRLLGPDDVVGTLFAALGPTAVLYGASSWVSIRARNMLARSPERIESVQLFQHRALTLLRWAGLVAFGCAVYLTPWSLWFELRAVSPALQVFSDMIVLLPYFAGVAAIWAGAFSLERVLRQSAVPTARGSGERPLFRTYLDFHMRHQVLVVAVPMLLILFAANVTEGWREPLQRALGTFWAPELLLGTAAVIVFALAPLMLKHIWHTEPLAPGALRDRLESLCGRIGLRCRDILVWRSDGLLINAAVMGVIPRVRYVLLSDGLLQSMDDRQIDAVFGHEAGHVRHHHIQHFLVFAYLGWLFAVGVMELALRLGMPGVREEPGWEVQSIGIAVTLIVWGVGFGWLSRRFERQADAFGAKCVTPEPENCLLPCSVHLGTAPPSPAQTSGRICATAAAVFAAALDRVAALNGIPHEERSWRHSSIGSRMRFLVRQAGDPNLALAFDRGVRRIKVGLLLASAVLSILGAWYYFAGDLAIARFLESP
jgi:STE24 endopeptidase